MPFQGELIAVGLFILAATAFVAVRKPIVLIWLHVAGRLILDSRPDITYANVLWNLSFVEIYTAAFLLLLLTWLLCAGNLKRLTEQSALIALIAVHVASSVVALNLNGFMEVGFKWMYLWVLVAYATFGLEKTKSELFFWAILLVLLYPLLNQALIGVMRGPKCFGPCSYVGTYSHESELASVFMLAIYIPVLLLVTQKRSPAVRGILVFFVVWAHLALWFNGYRTALVGVIAFWGVMLLPLLRRRVAEGLAAVFMGAVVIGVAVYLVGAERIVDEYKDIFVFLGDPLRYIEFDVNGGPQEAAELFSGRITLYNILMGHYVNSPVENIVIGLGPGASNQLVGTFAHNEFISALVETGLLGFVLLCVFLWSVGKDCWNAVRQGDSGVRVGVSMLVGILVTSLATMPYHDVRSIILMAIVMAVTKSRANKVNPTQNEVIASPKWDNLLR